MTASSPDRRSQAGMSLALLLVLLVGVASFVVIRMLISANERVQHTYEVLHHLEAAQSVLNEAESAQRGYLVSRDAAFLEPYQGSTVRVFTHIDSLIFLTADNKPQQTTATRLKETARERINQFSLVLDQFNKGYTIDMLDFETGKRKMDELRAIVSLMERREWDLMARRARAMERYTIYAPVLIILASLVSFLLTLYFYRRSRNESRRRAALLVQLQEQDAETHARITAIKEVAARIAGGDYSVRISGDKADDLGNLSEDLNRMSVALEQSFREIREREQHSAMLSAVSAVLVGEQTAQRLAARALEAIMRQAGATAGGLYMIADAKAQDSQSATLRLVATIGSTAATLPRQVVAGDNLAGRAFQSNQIQHIHQEANPAYETKTAAGTIPNADIMAIPVTHNGKPIAVAEIAAPRPFSEAIVRFLQATIQPLGAALSSAVQQEQVQELLHETQAQAEELQAQQEELESINQELTTKAQALQSSEEELRVQQEELTQTNQELEERGQQLAVRNQEIAERSEGLQRASEALRQSNQYKSDFLANMSHELRTPLNSVLLLSRLLSSNTEGNLTEQQTEYARVIENSGNGLLRLIDELLDLSKIEAGKMEAEAAPVVLWDVMSAMEEMFAPVAAGKGVTLAMNVDEGTPEVLHTDRMRLEQILRNLLSNALKFTEAGSVTMSVAPATANQLRIAVTDTGIGIPDSAQQYIFDAFRQADGSTQRKYGGTGLGLSISSRLAALLGGALALESEPGKGSSFILTLPVRLEEAQALTATPSPGQPDFTVENPTAKQPATDTRAGQSQGPIEGGRLNLLIVEDDTDFANALAGAARKSGFRSHIANNGRDALAALERERPAAVLLDLNLPDMQGHEVLRYARTAQHLHGMPVHVMSGQLDALSAIRQQADSALAKPVSAHDLGHLFETIRAGMANASGRLLIIEETKEHARALELYLNDAGLRATTVPDEAGAIAALQDQAPGAPVCIVVPQPGGDESDLSLLRHIRDTPGLTDIPAIIVTARSKGPGAVQQMAMSGATMVVKTAQAYKRIVDEASVFLNLVREEKPAAGKNGPLAGRHVLLADDDARNIYSLTRSLEAAGVRVTPALNGEEAVAACRQSPPDLVLMDIMMPVMDGYEATAAIRAMAGMRDLPIIAVTAKAMAGDRAKCLEAGCNDYITKPVDVDQLLSLLRVWLSV